MIRTLTCMPVLFLAILSSTALMACSTDDQTAQSNATPSAESNKPLTATSSQPETQLHTVRTAAETARDQYRHPAETLMFFEIEPEHTVVEIWPGKGWYTAVLAPYLRQNGQLIAAHFAQESPVKFFRNARQEFEQRFLNKPDLFGNLQITELAPPELIHIAPAGMADRVLTFRNVHNWMRNNQEQNVFDAAYRALKPGGILGVVEHRAPADFSREQMVESGYVSVAYVTQLAINSGFEPAGQSEVNANPKDTRDHTNGVWSLPPSLRGGDIQKDTYLAIGESDRMTLKFVKP